MTMYTTREQVLKVIEAGQVWVNDTYILIVCPRDKDGFYPFMYKSMWCVRHDVNGTLPTFTGSWGFHEEYNCGEHADAAGYIVNTRGVKMVDIGREYGKMLAEQS